MDIHYENIKKESKGYEYIQTITAFKEAPNHKEDADDTNYALFGKPLGNITIFRICGTKNVYEISKTSKFVYFRNKSYFYFHVDDPSRYQRMELNAKFVNSNNEICYFAIPYWK